MVPTKSEFVSSKVFLHLYLQAEKKMREREEERRENSLVLTNRGVHMLVAECTNLSNSKTEVWLLG